MKNEKFNAQKFLQIAGEEGLINLNLTLKEVATSQSFGYFNSFADDGDIVICPEFIFWRGPRPHREDLFENLQLANSLKESLKVTNDLVQRLGGLGR